MRIYRDTNGNWSIGISDHIVVAGSVSAKFIEDYVKITNIGTGYIYYNGPLTQVQKETTPGVFVNIVDENDFRQAFAAIFRMDNNAVTTHIEQFGRVKFLHAATQITRPANVTAYTAGDVVADTIGQHRPISLNAIIGAGYGVKIVRARIQSEDTGVTGARFNLHVFTTEPTFIADNAPFTLSYLGATNRVGIIPVTMGTGSTATFGQNDFNQLILNPSSSTIHFILEAVSGFSPSANSTRFNIAIDCEIC